jgi:hypothetical protein
MGRLVINNAMTVNGAFSDEVPGSRSALRATGTAPRPQGLLMGRRRQRFWATSSPRPGFAGRRCFGEPHTPSMISRATSGRGRLVFLA